MDEKMRDLEKFGKTWWGKEWIKSMLTFGRFYRMKRAVNYAKDGKVFDVIVNKGRIFAQCQGTAPVPYRITIDFKPLNDDQWDTVIEKLIEKSIYEAKLISGEMPIELNDIFKSTGIPLFPVPSKDLNAKCNCPDQAVPCKHIAALILTLARFFDFNPFILLQLRGLTKEELLNKIVTKKYDLNLEPIELQEEDQKVEDLTFEKFYFGEFNQPHIEEIIFDIRENQNVAELINQLGKMYDVENWNDFKEVLVNIYKDGGNFARKLAYKSKE